METTLITTKELYDQYISAINVRRNALYSSLKGTDQAISITKETIDSRYSPLFGISIIGMQKRELEPNTVENLKLTKKHFVYNSIFTISSKIEFCSLVYSLKLLYAKRKNIDRELYDLERNIHTYTVYKSVIKAFNKAMIGYIFNGYEWDFGSGLASIKAINRRNLSTKMRIDFGATKKLKAKLLAEGRELYREWTDENGNIVNNGGVQYLVKHTNEYDQWLRWRRKGCILPNKDFYNLKFTTGASGILKRFREHIAKNPTVIHKYDSK